MTDGQELLRPKAIVLDLDGTLLRSDQTISTRTELALRRYRENGGIIIIATGRPQRLVLPLLPELAVADYLIYNNGATVIDAGGSWQLNRPIPNETAYRLHSYVLGQHTHGVCIWEVEDQWHANRQLTEAEKACFLGSADSLVTTELTEESIHNLCPSKMLLPYLYDVENLAEIFERDLHIYRLFSAACIEIAPISVSKATGVELVAGRLGLSREEVAVFGDDYNDIAMFRYYPNVVAMANAIPELLAIAADTTASNDEDGVAIKLEQWMGSHSR